MKKLAGKFPEEVTVGAQGRLSINMPEWHIDYFELKLFKKRSRRGTSDPPLLSL